MLRAEDLLIAISVIACGASGLCYAKNKGDKVCRDRAYRLWRLGMIGIGTAFMLMLCYLVNHYFSFKYVYEHTNLELPFIYCISALWAGKEGSFLLWGFILVLMGYMVLNISYVKDLKHQRTFPVYAGITVAILTMSFVVRPFKVLNAIPADGKGLSKALQDPWMVVHPPLVFIGYTAMAIVFALGMNRLEGGDYEEVIKNWARKSMLFLGLGIMTGSVWAYRALGWGGYWAWDPIENIALVPWLLLCAYSHINKNKLAKQNGGFRSFSNEKGKNINWTRDKCILPFIIAAFGTFLVRSGLLANASVHAYVGKMARGRFIILGIFVVCIIGIIGVRGFRQLKKQKGQGLTRRTLDYIACFRVMTCIYAYAILIGTICPLFIKVQVPMHFYNRLTIGYVIVNGLLILGIERQKIGKKLSVVLVLGAVISVAMARYFDYRSVGLTLVLWIVLIPLLGYILTGLKGRNRYYYWTHLLLLVMLVGGITSAGMGGKFMKAAEEQAPMSIFSRMLEDRVIEQPKGTNLHEKDSIIIYTTKPLISLFWIGSFGLLGVMVIENARRGESK